MKRIREMLVFLLLFSIFASPLGVLAAPLPSAPLSIAFTHDMHSRLDQQVEK